MPKYRGPKEELDAARFPGASASELSVLAESQYSFVREAVAAHSNTEPYMLAQLIPMGLQSPTDQYIAAAIAANANTPPVALARLSPMVMPFLDNGRKHHTHFEIGVALCCNPNTPTDAVAMLLEAQQTSTTFRKVVARETKREDVLSILVRDKSEVVRRQVEQTLVQLR